MKRTKSYEIVWLIRRLFRDLEKRAEQHTSLEGISVSERAVMEFLYPDHVMAVPDIAERYGVSRQHVQVTVNELLSRGYVYTGDNPRHRRSPLLSLNEEGRRLFERIVRRDERALRLLFHGIDRERLNVALDTLKEFRRRLLEESSIDAAKGN